MNQIQQISQKIQSDRLKIQLGLDLKAEVDYWTLKAMSLQARRERLMERARKNASILSASSSQAA